MEVLAETDLSKIIPNQVLDKIKIDKTSIIIVCPDTNISVKDVPIILTNCGIILSNNKGLISTGFGINFAGKNIKGQDIYNAIKDGMTDSDRKLSIEKEIPTKIAEKPPSYFFYEACAYSKGLSSVMKKASVSKAFQYYFMEIAKLYKFIKNNNATINIECLLLFKNTNGSFIKLIENPAIFASIKKEIFFDNFCMGLVPEKTIIPIVQKKSDQNEPIISNFPKILTRLKIETQQKITEKDTVQNDMPDIGVISKMVKKFGEDNSTSDDDKLPIGISTEELRNILKKSKITDPDIVANVKVALDTYVKEKGEKLTKEESQITVLKAINYTIHGKEELDEEYILNPVKLFNKLKEIRTHQTPLEFPKNINTIIKPEDIISLKHTTGVWRHKMEFEKTIHENAKKLFQTLEHMPDMKIQVKSITHDIIDDDINRYILYKIKLQNTKGGRKEPYVVELKLPTTVNDRYFKINGSPYIMGTQQMLKPVTKTDMNEVRVITNYSVVRLGLKNLKFNPADINRVIEYIKIRYPQLITQVSNTECVFKDGSTIFFTTNNVYTDPKNGITIMKDPDTGNLTDGDDIIKNKGRNEYSYDIVLSKIQKVNPEDKLTKTAKTIPFIYIYLGGFQVPLIIYMWQIKGLLTTLNDFDIEYEISKNPDKGYYALEKKDGTFLVMNPKDTRQRLIVNGLFAARFKEKIKNFEDNEEIQPWIDQTYGAKATLNMNLITKNEIDPITRELLEFENLPTNLPKLISTHCVDKLLNDKLDSLSDLKLYRARLSEMFVHIMYKLITMSHKRYTERVMYGDENAQFVLDPEYVMRDIMGHGVLQHTEPVSPVDEIFFASRTIKSGPGGVPKKTMFKPEHRAIHPSQYGIMSANSTPESGNVGLIVSHTLTPTIVNENGSYGVKDINSISSWGALAINEALTPFQNEMDSERLMMATTHAKQVTPTDGSEIPLVSTGAEFIVPQISSSRFVQKSKKDGEVIEVVPNKIMTVKYTDGTSETFDIIPRLSRTKMGVYLSLEMNTLPVGTKVKKSQIIAGTKNFDIKNNMYCSGKNVFMAVIQYMGLGHEDSYVIGRDMADSMTRDIVKEQQIVIPPDTKVLKLETKLGKKIENKEILVEFSYEDALEDYINLNQLEDISDDEELLSTYIKGKDTIKLLGIEGEIVDIKVFINNKTAADPQILSFHRKMTKETNTIVDKLSANTTNDNEKIKAIDNMSLKFTKIGGHKLKGGTDFLGSRIVYYIKQKKPLMVGDKLATRYGKLCQNIKRLILKNPY